MLSENLIGLYFGFAALVILGAVWIGRVRPLARLRRRQARKVLAVLQRIEHPGQKFSYLRKINPFTFEELVLTAFERRGVRVIRNKRYTGDGGIDGRIVLDGEMVLIQAKRYSGAINPVHVAEFARICQRQGMRGIFIHTGCTGAGSRAAAPRGVVIVSGQHMLDLVVFRKSLPSFLWGYTIDASVSA